jgi:hypothetical protein
MMDIQAWIGFILIVCGILAMCGPSSGEKTTDYGQKKVDD